MNGHTFEITDRQRTTNEVRACLALARNNPDVEYWQRRLANALVAEHRAYSDFYDWGELYALHLRRQASIPVDISSLVVTS